MSDFKAEMHQIRFPLGLRLRPRWRSLQRSPDPLTVFKGPTSKGRKREVEKWKEGSRGGKEKGRVGEGKGGEGWSLDPPVSGLPMFGEFVVF